MARTHHTTLKSTVRLPIGQLALRNVLPQPEPQPDSPQYIPQEDDSFGIVVTIATGEEM
jgi:hypothetical protein